MSIGYWLKTPFRKIENTVTFLKETRSRKKAVKRNERIRIAFLAQYIPAWNKFESLYRCLKEDSRFEADLFAVPAEIWEGELTEAFRENTVWQYFSDSGYEVIDAYEGGEWKPLEGYDYVVYTRPYSTYMPKCYQCEAVALYAKPVSMLYFTGLTKDLYRTLIADDFYRHVYCFIAESDYSRRMFLRRYPLTTALGVRKSAFLGVPALEQVLADRGKSGSAWEFAGDRYKIIWTPRWTTDPKLGGSNFFNYYKSLVEYVKERPELALLVRPHPLAFDNFIKTGEMTEQEVASYKAWLESIENVRLDESKEYDATLWGSDLMVSDLSGIVPEFFVTGHPLVFCASNMFLKLAPHGKRLLNGCYCVNTQEELFAAIDQLHSGADPKKSVREDIISEVLGVGDQRVSERIKDLLIRDSE